MRRGFTSHAMFLVNRGLRLPENGRFSRYLVTIFTFAISAFFHMATASTPLRCSIRPQLQYHFTVAGAIVIEDALFWMVRSKTFPENKQWQSSTQLLWQLVGYSWVAFFNVWAVSRLVYQTVSCS